MDEKQSDYIKFITERLMRMDFYYVIVNEYREVMKNKDGINSKNFKQLLRNEVTKNGGEIILRNKVYEVIYSTVEKDQNRSIFNEPIDYIKKAKIFWERRFYKPLNNLCLELGIPFDRKRSSSEQKELENRWCELGYEELENSHLRPAYAPKDLLETLSRLRSPNLRTQPNITCDKWRVLHVSLKTKSFSDLRKQISKVVIYSLNIGIAESYLDLNDEQRQAMKTLYDERVKEARLICSMNYIPLYRAFALAGCPRGYRGHMWCQMLCVNVTSKDRVYYHHLKLSVLENDLMIDRLIIRDVKLTSSNDDQYFVFEEYLYQVMLLFSRDVQVLLHFLPEDYDKCFDSLNAWKEDVYPPNGIIPYHGLTMLVCPLCYVYDDPIILYFVFRKLYARYFYHLHHISSHSHGILRLSLLFEHLLEKTESALCHHFDTFSIQPIKCVFKWIMRAFSGYLSTTQVLLLWDLVIASDNIEILTVVAVAIFHFRHEVLIQASSQDEVETLLSDLTSISVIPVLSEYLLTANDNNDSNHSST